MKKCILIEACNWHEETLLNWVWYLNKLDYFVDLYTLKSAIELQGCFQTSLKHFRHRSIKELQKDELEKTDLIVLNTIIHIGYKVDPSMSLIPDIHFILKLNKPVLCTIHEPLDWSFKFPVLSYDYESIWETYRLFLHEDGSFRKDFGSWANQSWEIENNLLKLKYVKDFEKFDLNESGEKGVSNYNPINTIRRKEQSLNLKKQLNESKNIAFFALSDFGKYYLKEAGFDNSYSLFPTYYGDIQVEKSDDKYLIIPGVINFDKKNYGLLTRGSIPYKELNKIGTICFLGGSRGDSNIEIDKLKLYLKEHKIDQYFSFTGPVKYDQFYKIFNGALGVIPLIDEYTDGCAYTNKISASVSQAIAFEKIIIWDKKIAELYKLDNGLNYTPNYLEEGLSKFISMTRNDMEELRIKNIEMKNTIIERNRKELSMAIASVQ